MSSFFPQRQRFLPSKGCIGPPSLPHPHISPLRATPPLRPAPNCILTPPSLPSSPKSYLRPPTLPYPSLSPPPLFTSLYPTRHSSSPPNILPYPLLTSLLLPPPSPNLPFPLFTPPSIPPPTWIEVLLLMTSEKTVFRHL